MKKIFLVSLTLMVANAAAVSFNLGALPGLVQKAAQPKSSAVHVSSSSQVQQTTLEGTTPTPAANTASLDGSNAEPTAQAAEGSPAAQADSSMAGLGAWLDNGEAQSKAMELMAQGKYVRKSLLIVPMLFWMGDGQDQTRLRHRALIVNSLRDSLTHMARFDINAVSPRAVQNLRTAWVGSWGLSIARNQQNPQKREEVLGKLVDEKLTPDLLGSIMSSMKQRAEHNLTEAQQNSFMVDKAKESGVTAAELNLVLNSGYVVMPMIRYSAYGISSQGSTEATVQGGLILYKVMVSKDKAWLEKKAVINRVGHESVDKKGYSLVELAMIPSSMRTLGTRELVMHRAIDRMLSSAMQDMRDMPEFRLLSQMTWAEGSDYQIPVDRGEIKDVPMDKFFEQVEQIQDKDGSVKEDVTGWGFVYKPINFKYPVEQFDTNITDYIWQGYAVRGSVMSGIVTREYSRVPLDMEFYGGPSMNFGLKLSADGMGGLFAGPGGAALSDTSKIKGTAAAFGFKLLYSPFLGVHGLNFTLSGNYRLLSFDSLTGTNQEGLAVSYTGMGAYDVGLGVQKKWWIGPLLPTLGAEGFFGRMTVFGTVDQDASEASLSDYYLGGRAFAGLEFAFTPNIRLGATAGVVVNANLGMWSYESDGKDVDFSSNLTGTAPKSASLLGVGYEARVNLMVNTWPLTKIYDSFMGASTTGAAGAINQASLTPLP